MNRIVRDTSLHLDAETDLDATFNANYGSLSCWLQVTSGSINEGTMERFTVFMSPAQMRAVADQMNKAAETLDRELNQRIEAKLHAALADA